MVQALPSSNGMEGTIRQFFLFAGIGAVGTLVQYAVLVTLVQLARAEPVISSAAGMVGGAVVNYILNYRYTFKSRKSHGEALGKFMTVAVAGLALNTLVMKLAIETFALHYLLAQVVATGIVLAWNFAGNRLWTFRR